MLLVVLAVAGVGAVRFLQTTRGGVFLVDHGVGSAYPRVQRDIGVALKQGLARHGLRKRIRARATGGTTTRPTGPLDWDIACDDSVDLLRVNLSMTEAVEKVGGVVRRSEQFDGGRTLAYNVGTHSRDTHRLTLRRVSPEVARRTEAQEHAPMLAIVIDDFGYTSGGVPRDVLDLDMPLTISILPELRHSQDILRMALERHRCVMLHLPMESAQPERYDEEPIAREMSDDQIESLVRDYIASLPGIEGVNNHMGSLATTDARVMRIVCKVLGDRHLFLLDSLTSPKSVAYNTAVAEGVPAASNSLFIDDSTERSEDVEARLRELAEIARVHGRAVGIGHPHPWTLKALRESLDYLETSGVELVTVCDLVGRPVETSVR